MQPLAGAMGVEQPAIRVAHRVHHEAPGADGGGQPVVALEGGGGIGQGCDHQAVPVGQDLVVPARPDAPVADGLQPGAQARQPPFLVLAQQGGRAVAVQDGVVLPISLGRDVVGLLEEGRVFGAQDRVDLGFVPHIEFALDAFAVGIVGRGKTAAFGHHLAQHPVAGLGDALGIERAPGFLPDQGQQIDKLRIVVEHLLEMRDQPLGIRGVAREAAGQVIVDPTLAHAVERDGDGVRQPGAGAIAEPCPPDGFEQVRRGKFRRLAEAAPHRIALLGQPRGDAVEQRRRDQRALALDLRWPCWRLSCCARLQEAGAVGLDGPAQLVAEGLGDVPFSTSTKLGRP